MDRILDLSPGLTIGQLWNLEGTVVPSDLILISCNTYWKSILDQCYSTICGAVNVFVNLSLTSLEKWSCTWMSETWNWYAGLSTLNLEFCSLHRGQVTVHGVAGFQLPLGVECVRLWFYSNSRIVGGDIYSHMLILNSRCKGKSISYSQCLFFNLSHYFICIYITFLVPSLFFFQNRNGIFFQNENVNF